MQYYAVYYLGVCELTNLPLAAIDLGKYYPSIGDGMATVVDLGLKAIFSALFLYFRVINWFFMSKQVYEDTTFILDSKNLLAGFEYPCPEGSRIWRLGYAWDVYAVEFGVAMADCKSSKIECVRWWWWWWWWKGNEWQEIVVKVK